MSTSDNYFLMHPKDGRLQARITELESSLADAEHERDLLRVGQICLLHQLAAAREWKAAAVLGAIAGGWLCVAALRWWGL